MIYAGDNALHPAVEIASDIGDGFAGAERGGGLGVVEKNHGAAHALDADVKSHARAERRLFENESDEFALQRGRAARWQRIAREQPKWIWEFLRERVRRDQGIRAPAHW